MRNSSQSPVCADIQAERVGDIFPVIEHPSGQNHIYEILSTSAQLIVIEILIPFKEVFYRCVDASVSDDIQLGHIDAVTTLLGRSVARCSVPHNYIQIVMKMGVIHFEWFEYVFPSVLARLHAAGPLDESRQEEIAGIRV